MSAIGICAKRLAVSFCARIVFGTPLRGCSVGAGSAATAVAFPSSVRDVGVVQEFGVLDVVGPVAAVSTGATVNV